MDYEQIKNRLSPCGLDCSKCYAFDGGNIKKHSEQLKVALGNFDVYAERFTELLHGDIFRKYPDFKAMLTHFASAECQGCRKEHCKLFKDCKVRDCHEEKGVDFCFQCHEFPCSHTGFDEHLQQRSVHNNKRMKAIGVEGYYHEVRDKQRY
ncbi:MAG: DUF3795 domain-containing protein [Bacteroidales bacterium]|nr:DUF3795 domain-containing protein [Bacteroidales bacterium]